MPEHLAVEAEAALELRGYQRQLEHMPHLCGRLRNSRPTGCVRPIVSARCVPPGPMPMKARCMLLPKLDQSIVSGGCRGSKPGKSRSRSHSGVEVAADDHLDAGPARREAARAGAGLVPWTSRSMPRLLPG